MDSKIHHSEQSPTNDPMPNDPAQLAASLRFLKSSLRARCFATNKLDVSHEPASFFTCQIRVVRNQAFSLERTARHWIGVAVAPLFVEKQTLGHRDKCCGSTTHETQLNSNWLEIEFLRHENEKIDAERNETKLLYTISKVWSQHSTDSIEFKFQKLFAKLNFWNSCCCRHLGVFFLAPRANRMFSKKK